MNKKEFDAWYRSNLVTMAKLGVLHPDSTAGKTVHLAVASIQPQINEIHSRLNRIENLLTQINNVSEETLAELKAPIEQIKVQADEILDPFVLEDNTKEEPKPKKPKKKPTASKPKTKPKPKSTGWQIAK